MNLLLPAALALGTLTLPALTQKPRTVDEAVAAFARVREQAERSRYRAVRDLGRFAEPQATAVLLSELQRATTISYRQTVVLAIGREPRTGVLGPLQVVLLAASNPRLCDSTAGAMARQGEPGVRALAAMLPDAESMSVQRYAICYVLGRATGASARAALLAELRRSHDRDRLPPLRGLMNITDDPEVEQLRRRLAGDKDKRVAATALGQLAEHGDEQASSLAVELARRLGPTDNSDLHAAVLMGLLARPTAEHYGALLTAASLAEDAFGEDRLPAWSRAFEAATFAKWLTGTGVGKKPVGERCAAARALMLAPLSQRAVVFAGLGKLVKQRDAEVVQAATTALVALGDEPARAVLAAVASKGHATTVAIALGGLHALRSAEPAWQNELLQWSRHRQPAARTAALRLLARTTPLDQPVLERAGDNLGHKDWRVRTAAIELAVATRSKDALPWLFPRLDKERARLHNDVVVALRALTGLQFATTAAWQKWWAKAGPGFQPLMQPKPRKPGRRREQVTGVSYWNIPVRSERVTFVVDVSGSMSQPFSTGNDTRLAEARRQLLRVFDQLPKKAKTNVIAFAADGTRLFERLQSLDKKRRKLADVYVRELPAKGPTNVHAALRLAFADPSVDTIFLLTDGRPSVGEIVAPTLLADEIARWNLGRCIRIHTVAIGERSEFLERVANDSGGQHTLAR